ncbi:hypothetical protein [Thermococcus sp.]
MKKILTSFIVGLLVGLMIVWGINHFVSMGEWKNVSQTPVEITDKTTGSSLSGAIFAQQKGEKRRVIFVGTAKITARDSCGIFMLIPNGTRVLNRAFIYKDSLNEVGHWEYSMTPADKRNHFEEIAVGPFAGFLATGEEKRHGNGTAVIFLLIDPGERENITITISIGGKGHVCALSSKNVTVSFKR